MNNEEAKFILQGYRPGGQDANDPQFAEALRQVQKDPQLATWFANERALDSAIGAKLKALPIPSDLRPSILAGKKVVQFEPAWNRRSLLALAASVTLLLSLTLWWMNSNEHLTHAAYRQDMARLLTSGSYSFQITTEDVSSIKQWLTANEGHGDFALPDGMKDLPAFGCKMLDWHGKKVTFICMRAKGAGMAHLFVIDQSALPDPPPSGDAQFAKIAGWLTASWSQAGKSYLLASAGDTAAIQELL